MPEFFTEHALLVGACVLLALAVFGAGGPAILRTLFAGALLAAGWGMGLVHNFVLPPGTGFG